MKRFVDILLSGSLLVAFLPLGAVISIILRFTGDGEIFYRQERVGRYGKPFKLLKFTTMVKNSEVLGTGLITMRHDPRVTSLGKLLRKTKLNEVPQLLNILKGEMSIVGPRPLVKRHSALVPKACQESILRMTPGLTGIGSIVFRDEEGIISRSSKGHEACYEEDIAPLKAKLEIWYSEHQSLWLDLELIFLTAWIVVFPNSRIYRRLLGSEWDNELDALIGT